MKFFERIQNDFESIGISVHRSPFNLRNLLVLFVFYTGIISNWAYFFVIAKTFQEYVKSVFVATALISSSTVFAYIAWKMRKIFNFLNESEKTIGDSE